MVAVHVVVAVQVVVEVQVVVVAVHVVQVDVVVLPPEHVLHVGADGLVDPLPPLHRRLVLGRWLEWW